MFRWLMRLALALSSLFATQPTHAQTVAFQATKVLDSNAQTMGSGQICWPTSSNCFQVTNGRIPAGSSVSPGTGAISILNSSGATIYQTPASIFIGANYSFDQFVIPTNMVVQISGVARGACSAGAYELQTDVTPNVSNACTVVNGVGTWTKTLAGQPSDSGRYASNGAPAFACISPCTYTQADANPQTSAHWITVAPAGKVTTNWVQMTGGGGSGSTVDNAARTAAANAAQTAANAAQAASASCQGNGANCPQISYLDLLYKPPVPSFAVLVTDTYGSPLTGNLPTASTPSNTDWIETAAAFRPGTLRRVRMIVATPGTFKIKVIVEDGIGGFQTISSQQVTAAGTGVQVFDADRDFSPVPIPLGGFVALTGVSGAYSYGPATAAQIYTYSSNDTAAGSSTPIVQTSMGILGYNYDVSSVANTAGAEHLSMIPTSYPGWYEVGGSLNGYNLSVPTAGSFGSNSIHSGQVFGADRRTHTFSFQLTSPGTIAGFFCFPNEPESLGAGSMVTVNAAANTIEIHARYNSGATGYTPVLAQQAIPWTLALNHTYRLEFTKNNSFTYTMKLTDPATGSNVSLSRTASSLGYNPYPSQVNDQGSMHGTPGFFIYSGGGILQNFDSRINSVPKPVLYVIGDSITEDFGNQPDSAKYCSLLRAKIGETQVVCSGISGATTGGALARLNTEVQALHPQNVLIYLGSNPEGNTFAASLNALISAAQAAGSNVLVATVPTSASYTGIVNALSGVTVVHFDRALTQSGAGSAVIPGMYANTDVQGNAYNDGLHPNSAGHAAMAAQVLADAPYLLW